MTLTKDAGFLVSITPYFLTWIPHRVKPERELIGPNHVAGMRKRWRGHVEDVAELCAQADHCKRASRACSALVASLVGGRLTRVSDDSEELVGP